MSRIDNDFQNGDISGDLYRKYSALSKNDKIRVQNLYTERLADLTSDGVRETSLSDAITEGLK